MSRRTLASLLALVLLVCVGVVASLLPVPWVVYRPGPSVDVLGDNGGEPIIQVTGRQTYRDKGELRLLTVVSTGPRDDVNLVALATSWLDPDVSLYPRDVVYEPQDTEKSVRQESAAQMTSSKDLAVAAALDAVGIDYRVETRVVAVDPAGPAEGVLRSGDVFVRVQGKAVESPEQVVERIRALRPGTDARIVVRRGGRELRRTVTTVPAPDDRTISRIRVDIRGVFDFPVDVKLNISENIGGPSAGMMFAIGIYDVLTPGSLTEGRSIAGTGEIDAEGNVIPIGGVTQKIAAAERDGAELFLVPADNCEAALAADHDREKMELVRADDVTQAIEQIEKWAANPDAPLTRCEAS